MARFKKITKLITSVLLVLFVHTHIFSADLVPTTRFSFNNKDKNRLTINEALQKALDTNPEILFQKAEREVTRHKVTQVKGNYLPSVTVSSGAGRDYVSQKYVASTGKATGMSSNINANNNQAQFHTSIKLIQPLFDGTEIINDIKRINKEVVQSTENVSEAHILVAYGVFDAYISLRRFERLYKLAEDNIRVHESILSKMHRLVQAGKATSGDEESIRARLFNARVARGDIEGDLRTAYAKFQEVVGVEAKALSVPQLPEHKIPKTLKEAVSQTRKLNKSIIVAQATESVSRAEFDKTISPFMPRLDLELEARRNFNASGKTGHETNVTGQVICTFNIFNGGKDIGRRREIRAKMASARFRTQIEIRRAEKETRVAYGEMISARMQSRDLRKAVVSKQKVRDAYMKQFEAGTRSFVDILDASHEYFLTKGALITADAAGDLSIARLFASMGILLDLYDNIIIRDDMKYLGTEGHRHDKTQSNEDPLSTIQAVNSVQHK